MKQISSFEVLNDDELLSFCNSIIDRASKSENVSTKNLYFAGPWFSKKAATLNDACKKIYNECKTKSKYKIFFPNDHTFEEPKQAFEEDVNQIHKCDVVVAMIDDKDVGTAWEIGMAFALNKDIYLLGLDETSFKRKTNLMLAYTGKCFTLDKWHKFLTSGLGHDDFVNINKCWEAIE